MIEAINSMSMAWFQLSLFPSVEMFQHKQPVWKFIVRKWIEMIWTTMGYLFLQGPRLVGRFRNDTSKPLWSDSQLENPEREKVHTVPY